VNSADKKTVAVYQIETGSYVIQTGDKVTIIRFT
jgi:hypothetical protein